MQKIVDDMSNKLIELDFALEGSEGDGQLFVKRNAYVNEFESRGINSQFKYQTKLLGVPSAASSESTVADESQLSEMDELMKKSLTHLNKVIFTQTRDMLNQEPIVKEFSTNQ